VYFVNKKHIVVIVARGEAVRNFIFTDFLKSLSNKYKITLLTQINHLDVIKAAKPHVNTIIPLHEYKENRWVILFREILHTAHYRWIWTEAVKYYWGRHNQRVKGNIHEWVRLKIWRIISYLFANHFMLAVGTHIERWLSIHFRPTYDFDLLFKRLNPDLVFNCSHIHGVSADLPIRVANHHNIPTSVFLFSWDNLSSRGRIFPNYNKYFVWTKDIKKHLLNLYKGEIQSYQVSVSGTPQFDFHFDPQYKWKKSRLYKELGLDINRPFILYTTGMASDFPNEDRIVDDLIQYIKNHSSNPKPQLVIRTYIKGTSDEMLDLGYKYEHDKDIFFPPVLWDSQWTMPLKEDVGLYTNILRYASMGINTASTVSLELMIFGKPAINIGFEPPGCSLPHWSRFSRHVDYEHYRPIVKGEGVMVAKSISELFNLIDKCSFGSINIQDHQKKFLQDMFGKTYDSLSSQKITSLL